MFTSFMQQVGLAFGCVSQIFRQTLDFTQTSLLSSAPAVSFANDRSGFAIAESVISVVPDSVPIQPLFLNVSLPLATKLARAPEVSIASLSSVLLWGGTILAGGALAFVVKERVNYVQLQPLIWDALAAGPKTALELMDELHCESSKISSVLHYMVKLGYLEVEGREEGMDLRGGRLKYYYKRNGGKRDHETSFLPWLRHVPGSLMS